MAITLKKWIGNTNGGTWLDDYNDNMTTIEGGFAGFQAGSGNVGALTAGQTYTQNVTLPVAFPSDSYLVIVTGNNTGVPAVFGVTTRTTTYFTVQARALANSNSGYFHWIAMMR